MQLRPHAQQKVICRRELLVARLATGGQTLITAADEESLPAAARETMVRMPRPGVVDGGTGVAIASGIDFDPVHGNRFVRLSFAISSEATERALELIRAHVAAL